jgi:hypothetical protein
MSSPKGKAAKDSDATRMDARTSMVRRLVSHSTGPQPVGTNTVVSAVGVLTQPLSLPVPHSGATLAN